MTSQGTGISASEKELYTIIVTGNLIKTLTNLLRIVSDHNDQSDDVLNAAAETIVPRLDSEEWDVDFFSAVKTMTAHKFILDLVTNRVNEFGLFESSL